jgi:hypothetical protein
LFEGSGRRWWLSRRATCLTAGHFRKGGQASTIQPNPAYLLAVSTLAGGDKTGAYKAFPFEVIPFPPRALELGGAGRRRCHRGRGRRG